MWEDLPKLRNDNYEQLMMRYARQIMPLGTGQHKPARSKIWKKDALMGGKNWFVTTEAACFSVYSKECSGPMEEVKKIGNRIAQESDDDKYAKIVLGIIERLPNTK